MFLGSKMQWAPVQTKPLHLLIALRIEGALSPTRSAVQLPWWPLDTLITSLHLGMSICLGQMHD